MNTNSNSWDDPAGLEKRVNIYLEVNAKSLFNKPGLDLDDIEMWDSLGDYAKGEAVKDFETDLPTGKKVTWWASVDEKSEDEGFSIKIEQIEIIGENCLFHRVRLPGKKGKVQATVKKLDKDCKSTYAIWFSILNKEGESVAFRLDPKLKGTTTAITYSMILQNTINTFPIDAVLKKKLLQVLLDHQN